MGLCVYNEDLQLYAMCSPLRYFVRLMQRQRSLFLLFWSKRYCTWRALSYLITVGVPKQRNFLPWKMSSYQNLTNSLGTPIQQLWKRSHTDTFSSLFFLIPRRQKKTITFDWLVCLSLARKILEIGPKGRKSSCRSDSLVSSDKLVTLIVADSSNKREMKTINFSPYLSCIKNWNQNCYQARTSFCICRKKPFFQVQSKVELDWYSHTKGTCQSVSIYWVSLSE